MSKVILVVDYGTSNVRVNAIDTSDGKIVCSASKKYRVLSRQDGYAELSAEELWSFSEDCMVRVVEALSNNAEIAAISFSFFGDNLIPADKDGHALNDCILFMDCRGDEEAEYIKSQIPEEEQIREIGGVCVGALFGPKLLWVKRNMPETAKKIAFYDSQQQYVFRKLGLAAVNDYTMAARKQLLNLETRSWSKRFLNVLDISEESLGEIVGTGDIVGYIASYGRAKFPKPVPVAAGGHDADVAMIGMGVADECLDIAGDIAGTFDHVGYLADGTVNLQQQIPGGDMVSYAGPLKYTSMCLGAFPTAGAALEWFMRDIHGGTGAKDYQEYWDQVVFDGKGTVMVIPTVDNNRGEIRGLGVNTKKADIFKALIEALTFENRRLAEICSRTKKGGLRALRIGGGSAISDEWMQLRADITGLEIERMENIQISSLGSAVLAAAAVGIYPTLEEAKEKMIRVGKVFSPNPAVRQRYEEKYRVYMEVRERKFMQ